MVVPILAPRIMEIACGSDISPALTKPIVITVVALLLCNTAVVKAPASTPRIGFLLAGQGFFFIFSPSSEPILGVLKLQVL